MNSTPNLIIFIFVTSLVQLLLDIYVLRSWARFSKSKQFPRWTSIVPWIIAAIVFGFFLFETIHRVTSGTRGLSPGLFFVISFWYFPKFAILPFLLVRDVYRGVRWVVQKLTKKVAEPPPEKLQSRRKFLATTGWSLAAVPYATVGIGLIKTVYDYKVRHHEIVLPNLPRAMDGFTLVQISDIHAGSFPDHVPFEEAVRIVEQQKADAIAITGDFVNFRPSELSLIRRDLERLSAPAGVYASLGNHDHYNTPREHQDLIKVIREAGIDLLVNEKRRIGVGDASLVIAGTDNTGFKQHFANLEKTLGAVDDGEPTILLAHDPTFWDKSIVGKESVDLMLSGHTHGGQLGVSVFGFEWSPAQYVYKQWAGLYTKGNQQLYVNRGLGTVGPPLRIGMPPEITVITLRAPKHGDNLA